MFMAIFMIIIGSICFGIVWSGNVDWDSDTLLDKQIQYSGMFLITLGTFMIGLGLTFIIV